MEIDTIHGVTPLFLLGDRARDGVQACPGIGLTPQAVWRPSGRKHGGDGRRAGMMAGRMGPGTGARCLVGLRVIGRDS